MERVQRIRRSVAASVIAVALIAGIAMYPAFQQAVTPTESASASVAGEAVTMLQQLEVKGRAPKTGYTRAQFGDGWAEKQGCDTRNIILHRDLTEVRIDDECRVLGGVLNDPYTGRQIQFARGAGTSDDVQIDHVVALSDAWQKGAQQLSRERRIELANDPLELLAADGPANQQKGDGDAATWLPSYKSFHCQYVSRQISVKKKYDLWVTAAEKEAMLRVLATCPAQSLPTR